jgi:DNA-binding HxlR family transcriptional regulator
MAKALDVVGDRWTLLMVRELLLGPRRYKDFLESLEGMTTNLLAERLRSLEEAGLIEKRELQAPASGQAYELTPIGLELEPVLLALGKWGWRYMEKPARGDRVNIAWGLISLKRRYRRPARKFTVELAIGDRVFQYRLGGERPELREGDPWEADVRAQGDLRAFQELFFKGASSSELVKKGILKISGEGWSGFLSGFGLLH